MTRCTASCKHALRRGSPKTVISAMPARGRRPEKRLEQIIRDMRGRLGETVRNSIDDPSLPNPLSPKESTAVIPNNATRRTVEHMPSL
jgi:hypothetical protein